MSSIQIQTLDINEFRSSNPADKKAFVEKVGKSFREIGFLIVKGHDVSDELQKRAYEKIDAFFKMPVSEKEKFEVPGIGGARGYTVFGKEHAKHTHVGDLKEFFHVGVDIPADHPLAGTKDYPANVSVPAVEGFDETLRELFTRLRSLGLELLQAIALDLGLPENFFQEQVYYGNSILRPIHYPPLRGDEHPDAVRSSAHEDINLITLLIGASYPGLQALSRKGEWIPITTEAHQIVVNVGDMLQRLTNHRFVSTTHRVANPPQDAAQNDGSRRYSIPFFVHPVSNMSLKALDSCVSPDNPPKEPPIAAGEYLNQRLREIGLI
jgi:isopenicillin N synthase-like dioxygenase